MKGKWMLAPGGRVAHWWEPADIEEGDGEYVERPCSRWPSGRAPHWEMDGNLVEPGDAPRCKRCERAKAK